MYRHVLFDIDGTMIDSEPYYISCLQTVCKMFLGHPAPMDKVQRCFPMNSHDALTALGVSDDMLSKAVDIYDQLCFCPGMVPIFPGITELLTALSRDGAHLAMYSARFTYEFSADPAVVPLVPFFDEVIGVGPYLSKPDPEGVLAYMEKYHLSPQEVLYVGDSEIDSMTAYRAGIDLIMAEWKSRKNPCRYPARFYCSQPVQVLDIWRANHCVNI